MNKRFFYLTSDISDVPAGDLVEVTTTSNETIVSEISASDLAEVAIKGGETTVRGVVYVVTEENKNFFLHYLNGKDVKRIVFLTGMNIPIVKKDAKKVAKHIGGELVEIIPKKYFPRRNSADCIVLLN